MGTTKLSVNTFPYWNYFDNPYPNSTCFVSGNVNTSTAPSAKNAEFNPSDAPIPYRSARYPTVHGASALHPRPTL